MFLICLMSLPLFRSFYDYHTKYELRPSQKIFVKAILKFPYWGCPLQMVLPNDGNITYHRPVRVLFSLQLF